MTGFLGETFLSEADTPQERSELDLLTHTHTHIHTYTHTYITCIISQIHEIITSPMQNIYKEDSLQTSVKVGEMRRQMKKNKSSAIGRTLGKQSYFKEEGMTGFTKTTVDPGYLRINVFETFE